MEKLSKDNADFTYQVLVKPRWVAKSLAYLSLNPLPRSPLPFIPLAATNGWRLRCGKSAKSSVLAKKSRKISGSSQSGIGAV